MPTPCDEACLHYYTDENDVERCRHLPIDAKINGTTCVFEPVSRREVVTPETMEKMRKDIAALEDMGREFRDTIVKLNEKTRKLAETNNQLQKDLRTQSLVSLDLQSELESLYKAHVAKVAQHTPAGRKMDLWQPSTKTGRSLLDPLTPATQ